MNKQKLPKHLDPVTVIVRLATYLWATGNIAPVDAFDKAVALIGYADAADPNNLLGTAFRQFAKEI